jgi:hypothetical protein
MPSALHILRWSVICLACFFLLIRIRISAITAHIPVDIPGYQVNRLGCNHRASSAAGGGDGILHLCFNTFIIIIPATPWYPEMKFVVRSIVVYRDVLASVSNLKLLKCHFGNQKIKKQIIVNTRCFPAGHHDRHRILLLLVLTLDCSNGDVMNTLSVALQ